MKVKGESQTLSAFEDLPLCVWVSGWGGYGGETSTGTYLHLNAQTWSHGRSLKEAGNEFI